MRKQERSTRRYYRQSGNSELRGRASGDSRQTELRRPYDRPGGGVEPDANQPVVARTFRLRRLIVLPSWQVEVFDLPRWHLDAKPPQGHELRVAHQFLVVVFGKP